MTAFYMVHVRHLTRQMHMCARFGSFIFTGFAFLVCQITACFRVAILARLIEVAGELAHLALMTGI